MPTYNSAYTGAQVDAAVAFGMAPDVEPTEGSNKGVTSGGVFRVVSTLAGGITNLEFVDGKGYDTTGGSITMVDGEPVPASVSGISCAWSPCALGDKFTYTGQGLAPYNNWAYLRSDGTIISWSSFPWRDNYVITVSIQDAAYIVFNSQTNKGPSSYKGYYAEKQDKLTFDTTPTANSKNPVESKGIKAALDAKQNALTFDSTPLAGSDNPVTSGGVKTALDNLLIQKTEKGQPVTIWDGADNIPVLSLDAELLLDQDGTGTPDINNIREITEYSGQTATISQTADGVAVSVSCPIPTVEINGVSYQVGSFELSPLDGVGRATGIVMTMTGEESWGTSGNNPYYWAALGLPESAISFDDEVFSHLPSASITSNTNNYGADIRKSSGGITYVYVRPSMVDYPTADDFADYLRAQVIAGTPFQIYIRLADAINFTIPTQGFSTAQGKNVFSLVPDGEITLVYRADPTLSSRDMRGKRLRIMQHNIGDFRYGRNPGDYDMTDAECQKKLENYKRFFGDVKPDILGLQEYVKFMAENETHPSAKELFDPIFAHSSIDRELVLKQPAIWTNVKCLTAGTRTISVTSGSTYDKVYAEAILDITPSGVIVISCALKPDLDGQAKREAELTALMDHYATADNVIICIDMNARSSDDMEALLEIADAHHYVYANNGYWGSHNTYMNPINQSTPNTYYRSIDNILVKGNVKMIDAKVLFEETTDFPTEFVFDPQDQTYTFAEVTPVGTEDPMSEGWYIRSGNAFIPATDTGVVSGTVYFNKTADSPIDTNKVMNSGMSFNKLASDHIPIIADIVFV